MELGLLFSHTKVYKASENAEGLIISKNICLFSTMPHACGILVPWPRTEPGQLECRVLITGELGSPLFLWFKPLLIPQISIEVRRPTNAYTKFFVNYVCVCNKEKTETYMWYIQFSWRVPQSFPFYCFPLFLSNVHLRRPPYLSLLSSGNLHSVRKLGIFFPFSLTFHFSFPQLSVKPSQTTPFCFWIFSPLGSGFDNCLLYNTNM